MEFLIMFLTTIEIQGDGNGFVFVIGFVLGVGFYFIKYNKYRNRNKTFQFEEKTKYKISKIEKTDVFSYKKKETRNPTIDNNLISSYRERVDRIDIK